VRLEAAHGVGLNRDAEAAAPLAKLVVGDASPAVKREAATALGRLRQGAAVPALFDGLRGGGDRFLEHALTFALIEIADRDATAKGLADPSPLVRRAALVALDQMDGGKLTREEVTPLLNTDDPALQQAALAVMTAHKGWAGETVGLLREWLGQDKLDAARQESLRGALLAFSKDRAVQDLVAGALHEEKTPAATRLLLLETVGRAPLEKLPAAWVAELGRALDDADARVVRQAVVAVRAARVADFDARLLKLGMEKDRPADLRLAALGAATPRLGRLEPAAFDYLLSRLDKEAPPLERLAAASALGAAPLDDGQREALLPAVAAAGPLELPQLLAPYERTKSAAVGTKLVAALGKSPGLPALSPQALTRTLQGYPEEVRQAAAGLLKRIAPDAGEQQAKLKELEPVLSGGDAARGKEVFFGKKASCSACHTVGGQGGRVGPNLSTIGAVRSDRDLLEAIVYPSNSFARGYEPYVVTTTDGRSHTGVLARETADAVYLVTADRAEVRIARTAIDTLEPGRVSVMPQGLDAQLSRQELGDLIAFLLSLK
jgi:putative heme-binding domain-containing protein